MVYLVKLSTFHTVIKILMGLKTLMELLNNRYEKWYTKNSIELGLKMDNAIKIFPIYYKENSEIYF